MAEPTRRRASFSFLSILAALSLISVLSACSSFEREIATGEAPTIASRIQNSFKSNGRSVRVEMIRGEGSGRLPAVLMLHGASGVGNGWLIYPHGTAIAERGMHVFVVHYFDGLGVKGGASGSALHEQRERVISDAIAYVAARPDVDRSRIGLVGLSLGGFHALSIAARGDSRVAAVVDMMGAMPAQIPLDGITSMPPTLIMHGARDRIVPISRAFGVALMLDRIGAPYEMKVYMNEGHDFNGASHGDSIRLAADFLDRKLNGRENIAQLD